MDKVLQHHRLIELILGFFLAVISSIFSIVFAYPYYYSVFVIGMFLLFDAIARLLKNRQEGNLVGIAKFIDLRILLLIAIFVLLTDLIGGQIVFRLWDYPHYSSFLNWMLLYLIIYPVGGLSLLAMYKVFIIYFRQSFGKGEFLKVHRLRKTVRLLLHVNFFLVPFLTSVPFLVYFLGVSDKFIHSPLLYSSYFALVIFGWTFFFDDLTLAFGGKTLIEDVIKGKKSVIFAILLTGLFGAFTHELINLFSLEWQYFAIRMPFTTSIVLGIPVFVVAGWIFMVAACVSAGRMLQSAARHHNLTFLVEKEYLTRKD